MVKDIAIGTGRRKTAVARVFMREGSGKIVVNGKDVKEYFVTEEQIRVVRQPLMVTSNDGKFDIVINVTASPLMGYVHTASLYKQQVNATMVNNQPLMFGDEVVLKSNDLIQLPDATLRIVSPDEEETVF